MAAGSSDNYPLGYGTFRLSSLMLTVALISACLAVFRLAPPMGVGLSLILLPTLWRTSVGAGRAAAAGRPLDVSSRVLLFIESLGAVSLIAVASVVVFASVSAAAIGGGVSLRGATEWGDGAVLLAIILGVAAGLGLALWVAYLLARAYGIPQVTESDGSSIQPDGLVAHRSRNMTHRRLVGSWRASTNRAPWRG